MACENSQWAKVLWVDDNGGRGNFYTKHPPVSYELIYNAPTFTGGQCPNVQYKVVIQAEGATTHTAWQAWGCGVLVQWTSVPMLGKIKGIVEKPDGRIWIQYVHPTLGDIEDIFSLDGNTTNSIFWTPACLRINNPYRVLQGTAHIIGIIRVDGQPDNCGNLPTPCDFRITDSRGLVFTKTFDSACPIVTVECSGDKCPSNTCEVDCRGHKCCYNSQGQVVKVIS